MSKNEEYYLYLGLITGVFAENWNAAWEALPASGDIDKAVLREFMPAMFRRWYFSALVEDSLLSPANLVYALNESYGMARHAMPRLVLKHDEDGVKKPSFQLAEFAENKHPLVKDLQIFLEHYGPTFDVEGLKSLKIPALLSLRDGAYIGFLFDLAIHLRLVRKMPSVNKTVGMVNATWPSFFKKSGRSILSILARAVMDMTAHALGEVLPLNNTFRQKLGTYLKNPKSVDEIFGDMFTDSGIDILKIFDELDAGFGVYEELFSKEEPVTDAGRDIAGMHADIMTGAFFLGVSLDKFFLTPLSYYLRLIQPLYILPYDLREELRSILEMLKRESDSEQGDHADITSENEDETDFLLYAPCTVFTLSTLGEAVTGALAKNADSVFLPDNVPVSQLILSLKGLTDNMPKPNTMAMTIKISYRDDKTLWQNAEVYSVMTLPGLHLFICMAFGLYPGADYSFYPGQTENPFAEHTNRKKPKRGIEQDDPSLGDLAQTAGESVLYIHHSQDAKSLFDIKIMKDNQKATKPLPRIVRRGKGFIEQD